MSLSVLTLVKDRPDHLAQLIEGLRRSEAVPGELIIADMGSQPPVVLPALPFPARVLRLEAEGLPLAAARNAAARAAREETLLFLDVDCIPMHRLLGLTEKILIQRDALICAEVFYLKPGDARGEWSEADLKRTASPHPVRDFPAEGLREEDNAGLFWSLVFAIRRKRFFGLGGFDEAYTGYGAEDTDFGFRSKAAGISMLFMGGAGVGAFHQYHDTFDPPLQHFSDIVRNAEVFYKRWGQWPMDGWLSAFEDLGLIEWQNGKIALKRKPNVQELRGAFVNQDRDKAFS
jgi:GT2 family glycosyltransferase